MKNYSSSVISFVSRQALHLLAGRLAKSRMRAMILLAGMALLSTCGPTQPVKQQPPAVLGVWHPKPFKLEAGHFEAVVTTVSGGDNVHGAAKAARALIVSNHYALEKLESAGHRTAFAGNPLYRPPVDLTGVPDCAGFADGSGLAAKFCHPDLLRFDAAGTLYVADNYNFRVRKITPEGVVTTLAGNGESGYADGSSAQARFEYISGLALDTEGSLYVSDTGRIRKIAPDGTVSTLAGSGENGQTDGVGTRASFRSLYGLAVDSKGDVLAADGGSIRRVKPDGTVSTFVSTNDSKGQPHFSELRGMAIDSHDTLFVCDFFANRIKGVTPAGEVFAIAGSVKDSIDGSNDKAAFSHPIDIVLDPLTRELYVVQAERRELRKISFRQK